MAFIGNQIITINSLLDLDGQELVLDADADSTIHVSTDDQIDFKIGGTDVVTFTNSSSDFVITQAVQDKDIIFKGDDGGSAITALTLDMSEAGNASFNGTVTANAGVVVDNITIDGTEIDLSSGDLTIDVAGDISLDADGGDIIFKDGGSTFGTLTNNSGTFLVNANTNITTRAGVHTFDNTDGSSEYMRIDSSGNLFVGKTSSASATVGFEYNNAGQLAVTRSGDTVALLNRTSSDGNILDIRKDNTLVGSIGSVSGTDIELNSTLSGSLSAGGTKRFGWNTSGVFFSTHR